MALSVKACDAATPKEKSYKLSDGKGLYLEIMPNGSKYWRMKYRYLGKEKRLAFGVFPEVTLAEARDKCLAARKQLDAEVDPSLARQEARRQKELEAGNTFEVVAREWHDQFKHQWKERHAAGLMNRMEMDLFPSLGRRPISDIKAPELLATLRKIESRGAHEITHRAHQISGRIFRYAIATGRAERDPSPDLRGALKPVKKGHYAALDSKALPKFIQDLNRNDARLYPQTIRVMKLMMLTFVRTAELIEAKWEEIDFDNKQWVIPGSRMKMGHDHIVPLSDQALSLFIEQKEVTGKWEWVFPNQVRPKKPMSNNTILMALNRMGYKGMHTGHGFRALAMSTIKENLGYRHEVVDRQLAHGHKDKIAAAYDRAQFLPERKKMMQHWADYVDDVANDGKVVQGNFKKRV